MRIDAITCCVGELYAGQLARSIDVWLSTLDSLTIVTKPGDPVLALRGPRELRFVETEVFTEFGAYFNKAAGLNLAYAATDPTDWVLHFDSDIIPPADWRSIAEAKARRDCLSGAHRYDEHTGERLDEVPLYPYGYFHLWHTSAPQTWRWPLFDPWFEHAGSYDANFTDLWTPSKRKDLGFKLIHQGERRTNWYGAGADQSHMQRLREVGYRNARKKDYGRLPIPEPKLRLALRSNQEGWARDVLRACRIAGPFAVEAMVRNDVPKGWEKVRPAVRPHEIQRRVLACLK